MAKVNIDRGSRSRSEIEVARKKLDTLGQTIKEKRLALAHQTPGVLHPDGELRRTLQYALIPALRRLRHRHAPFGRQASLIQR